MLTEKKLKEECKFLLEKLLKKKKKIDEFKGIFYKIDAENKKNKEQSLKLNELVIQENSMLKQKLIDKENFCDSLEIKSKENFEKNQKNIQNLEIKFEEKNKENLEKYAKWKKKFKECSELTRKYKEENLKLNDINREFEGKLKLIINEKLKINNEKKMLEEKIENFNEKSLKIYHEKTNLEEKIENLNKQNLDLRNNKISLETILKEYGKENDLEKKKNADLNFENEQLKLNIVNIQNNYKIEIDKLTNEKKLLENQYKKLDSEIKQINIIQKDNEIKEIDKNEIDNLKKKIEELNKIKLKLSETEIKNSQKLLIYGKKINELMKVNKELEKKNKELTIENSNEIDKIQEIMKLYDNSLSLLKNIQTNFEDQDSFELNYNKYIEEISILSKELIDLKEEKLSLLKLVDNLKENYEDIKDEYLNKEKIYLIQIENQQKDLKEIEQKNIILIEEFDILQKKNNESQNSNSRNPSKIQSEYKSFINEEKLSEKKDDHEKIYKSEYFSIIYPNSNDEEIKKQGDVNTPISSFQNEINKVQNIDGKNANVEKFESEVLFKNENILEDRVTENNYKDLTISNSNSKGEKKKRKRNTNKKK